MGHHLQDRVQFAKKAQSLESMDLQVPQGLI